MIIIIIIITMHKALHPRDDVEKREEEDLSALKTALTQRYDSKTIHKNTMKDTLQPSETILITRWITE